ncbi:MAG: T9SS type A sorting domain-containing protein [Saprospiraceae bacterium]|nr:T9SS type A sorting domain-containing protein [Saprospiraceae bacterium]MBK9689103.1 T9SS type A sorting domain-containing protein [Saprospiraceae bacterium]
MKRYFTILLFFFSIYRADTQIVISPDTACIHVDTNGIIDTVKLTITNNTAAEVSLYWTLDLGKNFPSQWRTQICDFNLCYDYNVRQQSPNKPNKLAAGATNKTFSFYLTDSFNYEFIDTVYIVFYTDKTFKDTLQVIPILIGGCNVMSHTFNVSLNEVVLQPNPSFDGSFEIRGDNDFDRIELYDMMGRLILKEGYEAHKKYEIPNANSGMSVVKLISDKRNQVVCRLLMVQ